jgi:hypothetical protein
MIYNQIFYRKRKLRKVQSLRKRSQELEQTVKAVKKFNR